MPDLNIPTDVLAELILRVRAVQGREATVDAGSGSNPVDDGDVDALQETPGDLSRAEVRIALRDLEPRQQAELVALMWIGRGDAEPDAWERTVALARERRTEATEDYLLGEPLVADYWADGLARLGVDLPLGA